ncbi:Protein CBG27265 [Caenorhabditis briggsae]|uniref:Protein CBG27265 n=1 Tax=Caenorhabditis briggsae TaxID=6238 RepID=B6IFT4_CAEBR|nr:Protein CBG27265 [Caenorhabditis briggsae]CAR98802.1 Protein CBG27265 [Caenorhabditis briggsae]
MPLENLQYHSMMSAALEIPLLTGHGSHTDRKVSEIQRMLLIHLDGRIRTPELNLEMLILFFAKKRMYSEILLEEFSCI